MLVLYSHLILGFVQAVGQSSSCWLIDDTQDVQTGDLTSVFGSLEVTETIRECDVPPLLQPAHSINTTYIKSLLTSARVTQSKCFIRLQNVSNK